MKKHVSLLVLFILSTSIFAETLAKIGEYTITDKDVKNFMEDFKKAGPTTIRITEDYALNKLIDIKLGVIDAKNQALDQDTKAKEAMDNALYSYYLDKTIDSKYKNKNFSNTEIVAYYQKNPLVKIQRIAYSYNNNLPGDLDRAKAKMSSIRTELKAKRTTFDAVIEKNQDKIIPALTGTFDKIVVSDLAPQEMIEVKPLKPTEISAIILGTKFLALTRVIAIYPYSPEYAEEINERMKREAIMGARDKALKGLRQKYATMIQIK